MQFHEPHLTWKGRLFSLMLSTVKKCYLFYSILKFCFSGDIIMTGEGHKDWLSDCDFHPGYGLKIQLFIFLFLISTFYIYFELEFRC